MRAWQNLDVLSRLPGWVIDNAESVRREAVAYRGLSIEKKLELVASACRTAALLIRASPNRGRALSYVDPLPRTTVLALARLMREHREGRTARSHADG